MSIELKRRAEMLGVVVASLVLMTLVALPGVAEAQGTDGATVDAAQDFARDAYATAASQHTPEAATRVVVRPGDSLWSISQERLRPDADPAQIANEVGRIYQLNRDRIGDDANLILAGQELLLPPPVVEPALEGETPRPVPEPGAEEEQAPESASALFDPDELSARAQALLETRLPEPPTTAFAPEEGAPTPSEAVEPIPSPNVEENHRIDGSASTRRVLAFGILALTVVLVGLMAWKLPLRRDIEERVRKMPAGHSDHYDAPPALEDATLANNDPAHVATAGAAGGRPKEPARAFPPKRRARTSRPRRLPRKGWATGVHNPQVRRFLKRAPQPGGRRAAGPTEKPRANGRLRGAAGPWAKPEGGYARFFG